MVGNAKAFQDKDLKPTVILNPALDSPLMKEEIFGPLLPVITYNTFDQCLNTILSQPKPLVIYYFGPTSGQNFQKVKE
jgi:acyl-CoA reductase-like NAD-dependent aldehyde dehydrogenase